MFRDVLERQAGVGSGSGPSSLDQHFGKSLDLIHRLQLDRKLDKHEGCVNTVSFTQDGERLVSGSDDLYVNVWNWQTGTLRHEDLYQVIVQICTSTPIM